MEFIFTQHSPELGTNRFAGMGIGAKGAKMSAGAGANPPGLAVLLFGFRTSTYRLLVPERKETHLSGKKQSKVWKLTKQLYVVSPWWLFLFVKPKAKPSSHLPSWSTHWHREDHHLGVQRALQGPACGALRGSMREAEEGAYSDRS